MISRRSQVLCSIREVSLTLDEERPRRVEPCHGRLTDVTKKKHPRGRLGVVERAYGWQ